MHIYETIHKSTDVSLFFCTLEIYTLFFSQEKAGLVHP